MSISLVVNGTTFSFPETGNENWADEVTNWASAVTSGMLQKAGGNFVLTSEIDFGANFGIKSLSYKTRTSNVSLTGVIRLGKTDFIGWRDNANVNDLELGINTSDQLTFNSNPIISSSALTASRTLVSDSSGVITTSSVTSTELSYLSGVTSAIQTQLGTKITSGVGAIVNADVNASAAIAYSKLNLTGSILNADINTSAAIVYSKLSLSNSIVDADINASAAIAYSKLNLTSSIATGDLASGLLVPSTKGGTGVNNTGTLTYGANNITVTTNGVTSLTVPTSGTLSTLAGTEVLTNKDIDGGTAANTRRITIPKDTLTNLQALTRKEGTILYATDTDKFYADDGTILREVGSNASSGINYLQTNNYAFDFEQG